MTTLTVATASQTSVVASSFRTRASTLFPSRYSHAFPLLTRNTDSCIAKSALGLANTTISSFAGPRTSCLLTASTSRSLTVATTTATTVEEVLVIEVREVATDSNLNFTLNAADMEMVVVKLEVEQAYFKTMVA